MNDRLTRLVGNGDEDSGGMPLPLLFNTLLEHVLEHGSCSVDEVREKVERSILKHERVPLEKAVAVQENVVRREREQAEQEFRKQMLATRAAAAEKPADREKIAAPSPIQTYRKLAPPIEREE